MIKRADRRSCVVASDRKVYLLEVEKQLSDTKVWRELVTLKIFLVSYQKQVMKCLVV